MIPTYNQEKFIAEAIDSALMQSYKNLEIIVGDDASSDTTPKIIQNFRDPRLKTIFNRTNIGRVANYRQLLHRYASGDYAVNLDGDDYYTDPNFIKDAVDLIGENKKVVMVVAKICWKTKGRRKVSEIPPEKELTGNDILQNLPQRKFLLKHMGTIYKLDIAKKINFYRYDTISSDWESLYRLAMYGQVKYLDKTVGVWRKHDRNETKSIDFQKFVKNLEIWPSIFSTAQKQGMKPRVAILSQNRCIGYFANRYIERLSVKGITSQSRFLFYTFKRFKTGALFVFYPPYCKKTLWRTVKSCLNHNKNREKKPEDNRQL